MKTWLTKTPLPGLVVVKVDHFEDVRGFFIESWHKRDFAEAGLAYDFIQDSHSRSGHRVIRGLHYQDMRAPMVKLVRCTFGRILDVAVDLRVSSPSFGKWFSVELSAENKTQIYVPEGFAHGFAAVSNYCEIQYKQTNFYDPDAERGIAWDDPDVGIEWPIKDAVLSKKDQQQPSFAAYRQAPVFQ